MKNEIDLSSYFDCATNGRITLRTCDQQRVFMGAKKRHPCRDCSIKDHSKKTLIPASLVLAEAQAHVDAVEGKQRDLHAMAYQLRRVGGLRNV